MANVQIIINKGNGTTINVSGLVEDSALAPFTDQLATLLATAANAPVIPPLAPLNPSASVPITTISSGPSTV